MSSNIGHPQRLMSRNRISVRNNPDGTTMAIIRHNKGAHTLRVTAPKNQVIRTICEELHRIHDSGEKLTIRQKADRVRNALI